MKDCVGVPTTRPAAGLRDDVYRRPLATALDRLGLGPGWRCVDVGAGGGDVSVALAEVVGHTGRVYAVDSDPLARDEVGRRGGGPQPGARHHPGRRGPDAARTGRPRLLPVPAPARARPVGGARPDGRQPCGPAAGWSPRSRSPRPVGSAGCPCRCPTPATPTSGRCCPALVAGRRARDRRRLGRGTGRRRPRAGRRLPGVAHRRRPRRRPGRPAAARHRVAKVPGQKPVPGRGSGPVGRPSRPHPDLAAAAAAVWQAAAAVVDAGGRHRTLAAARGGESTPTRSSPTTWPTPPPPRPSPEPQLDYGAHGDARGADRLRLRRRRRGRPGGRAGRAGAAVGGGPRPRCRRPATVPARRTGTRRSLAALCGEQGPRTSTRTSSWSARPSTASPRTRSAPTPSTSTAPTATSPRSIIAGLAELGGFGLSVPEAYGGFATGRRERLPGHGRRHRGAELGVARHRRLAHHPPRDPHPGARARRHRGPEGRRGCPSWPPARCWPRWR